MQIFISHSSQDKPFARRLRDEIQKRGLRVWLDEAEVRVGQSIPEEIGRAVESSEVFCILISQRSSRSPWVTRELNAFLPRMISKGGVILPCKLDDAPTHPLLADIKYADFSESYQKGLTALLNGIHLKEEIDKRIALEDAKNMLLTVLTPGELVFFVHYFQRYRSYFVADRTEDLVPAKVLSKLVSLGVLEKDADKYEVLFTMTDLGEDLLEAVSGMVPEEKLAELDKTEGPRNPKRLRSRKSDSAG